MAALIEVLQQAGVDTQTAVARFASNTALYERFIQRFMEDDSFSGLQNSLREKNDKEAMRYAHTLKGVAANLGMDALGSACDAIVKKFRAGDNNVEAEYALAAAEYEKLTAAIRSV